MNDFKNNCNFGRSIQLKKMLKKLVVCICIGSVFAACKLTKLQKNLTKEVEASFYDNHFTGLYVYDLSTQKELINYQGEKYFTPASNTKIATLYTALQFLSDSIPAVKYDISKDTLWLQGTGNPTFLHSYFKDSTALHLAKKHQKVIIITGILADKKFGPGWAWEDYDRYFSPEKSAFPMYGNVVHLSMQDSLKVRPSYFQKNIVASVENNNRDHFFNTFYYSTNNKKAVEIPMIMNDTTLQNLWNALLPNSIATVSAPPKKLTKIAYSSIPTDSLLKRMMLVSDNFLAEQLLLLASSTQSDTLTSSNIQSIMLNTHLKDLAQQPRWVDGSGLSRYNLFSPISLVAILEKLYQTVPQKRLFNFFPVGGKSGTLKQWFKGDSLPYVYAKSGTLGNNYSLSGYLKTSAGKVLAFSFMNNHFKHSSAAIKKQMERVLKRIRDRY